MLELLGVLVIILFVYVVIKDDGPRYTYWNVIDPGEIKWPKLWKRKKKK